MGDPYSTYDRRGRWVVVPITMKTYLEGKGLANFCFALWQVFKYQVRSLKRAISNLQIVVKHSTKRHDVSNSKRIVWDFVDPFVKKNLISTMGDPFSTNDRRGGWVVVPITMKKYLGGRGLANFLHTFSFKAQKGPTLTPHETNWKGWYLNSCFVTKRKVSWCTKYVKKRQ